MKRIAQTLVILTFATTLSAYGQLLQPTSATSSGPVIVSPWDPEKPMIEDEVLEYASDGVSTAVAFGSRDIQYDPSPETTPVYVTHDRGLTWAMTDTIPVMTSYFHKPNDLKADGFVQNGNGTWMFWGRRAVDLFFRSTDNGETWTALDDPFANEPAKPAFVELAIGGNTALLASVREINITTHTYAYTIRRSTNMGDSWSAIALGNRTSGQTLSPRERAEDFHFATDGAGNWLFMDSDYVSRSSDDGVTWDTIRFPGYEDRVLQSRAIHVAGTEWLAILDVADTTKFLMTRSLDGGATWSTPENAFDRIPELLTSTFTKRQDGKFEVALVDRVQITENNGAYWSVIPYQGYSVPRDGRRPRVLFDDRVLQLRNVTENDAYEWGPDKDIVAAFSFDEGQTFTDPELIQTSFISDFGAGDRGETTLYVLPNGDILSAWATREDDGGFAQFDYDIVVMRTNPDGEWVWNGPVFVNTDVETDSANDSYYDQFVPIMRRGAADTVRLIWIRKRMEEEKGTPRFTIMAADSADNGETWSDPEIIGELADTRHYDAAWLGQQSWVYLTTQPDLITVEDNSGVRTQIDLDYPPVLTTAPALAANGNGSAIVVVNSFDGQTDSRGTHLIYTSDYGATWDMTDLAMPEGLEMTSPALSAVKLPGGDWIIAATFSLPVESPSQPGRITTYLARSATPSFESATFTLLPGGDFEVTGYSYAARRPALFVAPDALYFATNYVSTNIPDLKGNAPPTHQLLMSTNGGSAWREVRDVVYPFDPVGTVAIAGGTLYNAKSDSNTPSPRPPQYRVWQVSFEFAEDINGSGSVDAIDIQLVINALLNGDATYDINDDGTFDATDLQALINAVLAS